MEYYIKNGRQVIDNNTLAALTLLIAESNPKEKPVIIDLVMNFLNNEWKVKKKWRRKNVKEYVE